MEPSGPKVPPVSHAAAAGRAVLTAIESPRPVPETTAPKREPWAKFQARCRPIGTQRRPVKA